MDNRKKQNNRRASPKSSSSSKQSQQPNQTNNRNGRGKGNNNNQQDSSNQTKEQTSTSTTTVCNSLDQFSARAQEIKQDIFTALEKQSQRQSEPDEPAEIVQLKNDILKLSCEDGNSQGSMASESEADKSHINVAKSTESAAAAEVVDSESIAAQSPEEDNQSKETVPVEESAQQQTMTDAKIASSDPVLGSFEPLSAKLNQETKYASLVSSLEKNLEGSPGIVEPICKKLVQMSEQISRLQTQCDHYEAENKKLLMIKQKLENLCRELQKSNNAIRIESLDLIKLEQGKAKEQTTKIQSTLSGVIKLFDENQQRNMALREENQELQTKLRSLLEHCDNWEKGFNAALRQRDIENRLVKTELAKANLLKNEEKERFLKEKQDLLHLLSMMQEHQSRIEGQEAKLRTDLSNYASKYDECQAVISQGMSKFQTESKRMLKQMEKSKQDYKVLLTKYESSNRRMAQLLEEKQRWDKSMIAANKKIETLEKLCRALSREQKDNHQPNGKDQKAAKHEKHQPAVPDATLPKVVENGRQMIDGELLDKVVSPEGSQKSASTEIVSTELN